MCRGSHWCHCQYDLLIDVDGLVLVQAEDVSVFSLEHRIVIQRPAITDIELLGDRIAVVGVDKAADATVR